MQEWKPIIRHCRNCGAKTVGFKNKDGVIKVQCPKCGELNKSLNLKETKGWYECSKCGSVMQVAGYDLGCVRIPIIEWKDLPKLAHKV